MMSRKSILQIIFISFVFAVTAGTAIAQGTAFSFQGRLNDGANPANGSYDLQFRLYDAIMGGNLINAVVSRPNTTLINGVFSVTLDFGATAFNNPNSVFIEIAVRPNGSPNAYTILGPRQQLTVVPFAVRSATATLADNATNAANAQNAVNAQNSVNATNAVNATTATTATNSLSLGGVAAANYLQTNGNGSQLTNVNAITATTATTANNALSLGGVAANGWARLNVQNTGSLMTTGSLQISGNATQFTTSGGFVKAMVYMQYDGSIPTLIRCFNGFLNTTSGNCGFSYGTYSDTFGRHTTINFGFQVNDRFVSATGNGVNVASFWSFPNSETVDILSRGNSGSSSNDCFIFVY